jgi:hypothetical protein
MGGVKPSVRWRLTLPEQDRMVQIANERSFGATARSAGEDVGPDGIVLYTLNTDARTPT